jgi:hypothetical protein
MRDVRGIHLAYRPNFVSCVRTPTMCVGAMLKSDTPRRAGGLMSWAASKAVDHKFRRRAIARLC